MAILTSLPTIKTAPTMTWPIQHTCLFYPIQVREDKESLNQQIKLSKNFLPLNHVTQSVYKSKKLGSYFKVKDSTKLEHRIT